MECDWGLLCAPISRAGRWVNLQSIRLHEVSFFIYLFPPLPPIVVLLRVKRYDLTLSTLDCGYIFNSSWYTYAAIVALCASQVQNCYTSTWAGMPRSRVKTICWLLRRSVIRLDTKRLSRGRRTWKVPTTLGFLFVRRPWTTFIVKRTVQYWYVRRTIPTECYTDNVLWRRPDV